jgi:hypothetical protein
MKTKNKHYFSFGKEQMSLLESIREYVQNVHTKESKLVILPALVQLLEQRKVPDHRLCDLVSHTFGVACFVCGRRFTIVQQLLFNGGVALEEEITASLAPGERKKLAPLAPDDSEDSVDTFFVKTLLDEMGMKSICCRTRFLGHPPQPLFLGHPISKKEPLAEYLQAPGPYLRCRTKYDTLSVKGEKKTQVLQWNQRSATFVACLLTFRSFHSTFAKKRDLPLCSYFGHVHLGMETRDLLLYMQECCEQLRVTQSSFKETFCFSFDNQDSKDSKLQTLFRGLLVMDPSSHTLIVCHHVQDTCPKMWDSMAPELGRIFHCSGSRDSLEMPLTIRYHSSGSLLADNEWLPLFWFVHLQGADEYRKNLEFLRTLVSESYGQTLPSIRQAMKCHMEQIRSRYSECRKEVLRSSQHQGSLYERWKTQFHAIVLHLVEDEPLTSHTSSCVDALMHYYS